MAQRYTYSGLMPNIKMEKVLIKEICYKREAQCAPCVQNSLPQVCGEWFCMKNTSSQYCEDSFGAQNTLPQVCGDSFCTKDALSEPSDRAPPTQGDPFGAFGQGTPDPRRPTPSFRTRHPRPEETHSGLSDKATTTRGDPVGAFGQGNPDPGRPTPAFPKGRNRLGTVQVVLNLY